MADQEGSKTLRVIEGGKIVPLTLVGVPVQTLERVLEHLQKEDELFDYNIPQEWRNPAKEGLQEFLIETYQPEDFEITEKSAVEKYVRLYDFVAFSGNTDGFQYKYYLKPGMKDLIKSVNLKENFPLTVLWEPCDEFPKEIERCHNGIGLSLLPKGFFRREKISNRVELLAEASPGRLVEPTEIFFEYSYYLPTGTIGIVTEINKSQRFAVSIVFGNTEGYIPPSDGGRISCTYNALTLFRENKIDIRKLINDLL